MKDNNKANISIDAKEQCQHSTWVYHDNSIKWISREHTSAIIKAMGDKTHSWHHTQWWKIKKKRTTFTSTILIQVSTTSLSHSNPTRRNKRHPECWGRKLSLFADGTILYLENPKDSPKRTIRRWNWEIR